MNLILKKSILIIFILTNVFTYSQVSVSTENMQYSNGDHISNCDTIDFGSNHNISISFWIKLTKPVAQVVGDGYLDVMINNIDDIGTSMSTYPSTLFVPSSQWSGSIDESTYNTYITVPLDANFFNTSGGILFIKYTSSGNIEYYSCRFSIIKDELPTFEINPSSTSVSCGSTSPKTFSVTNVYNSPGSLEYHWNVGNGWKRNGSIVHTFTTTTNNIDLEPYQFPPSNVSVTPYLDGVAYNTLTSVVHLSEFTTTNDILGQDAICSSGNYQLENSLPNDYNVEWSIDNPFLASLVVNGQTVTIQAINNQNGPLVLSAKITNSCNQFVTITKTIYIGAPDVPVNLMHVLGGWDNVPAGTTSQLHVNWIPGATAYKWTIQNINHTGTGTFPHFVNYGGNPNATTIIIPNSTYIDIQWGTLKGEYVINCWAINNCAQTPIGHKIVNVFDSSNNPCPPMGPIGINPIWDKTANIKVKVYPNPIGNNDVIYVNKIDPSLGTGPCNNSDYYGKNVKTKNILNIIKIYDKKGKLLFEKAYQKDQIKIKDLHLKSDTYFLVLQDSNGNMERTTLIVK